MLVIEAPKWRMLILFAISLISVWIAFKPILKVAKLKNITDCPDPRKLQKHPIPVLGGAAVFFGIIIGLGFFKTMFAYPAIFPIITAAAAMLYIGIVDDILSIKPWKRMLLEAGAALLIIYGNRYYIANLQGLWGVDSMPMAVGILLSVITFVGIVNAVNMIDGVDGLCSGFCILACICFGTLFFFAHEYSYCALAAVAAGALVPFFIHNVIGLESKMFLGDGGSMVMGTLVSSMVFELLCKSFGGRLVEVTSLEVSIVPPLDFNLVAFCLAVLAIPVFDTLRVMAGRLCRGVSPFSPDKTHLHHLFVDAGFSYIFTTLSELILDIVVIAVMLLSWNLGASIGIQLYVTVAVAIMVDAGAAAYLRYVKSHPDSFAARRLAVHSERSHIERKGFWLKLQKLLDRNCQMQ